MQISREQAKRLDDRLQSPVPFPSTQRWLSLGGDERIHLDPQSGVSRYFTSTTPEPRANFGSSTASTISPDAFAAADRLREQLVAALRLTAPDELYRAELRRIGVELHALWGLDDLPGSQTLFAASGTDIHLMAAQLLASLSDRPVACVGVDAAETGSGVPDALSGRHFSASTALGATVRKGDRAGPAKLAKLTTVAIRHPDGTPRSISAVRHELEAAVARLAQDHRVLLCMADLSKTGLVAPDIETVLDLSRRYPGRIEVLVDACQFRLSRQSLKRYLAYGFMVAATGSKFFTGPTFCGALFMPGRIALEAGRRPLGAAMSGYATRADLPSDWIGDMPAGVNFGLLLRWEAALHEMRAFHAVPEWKTAKVLLAFERLVSDRLATEAVFEALPTPRPNRRVVAAPGFPVPSPMVGAVDWDGVRTIFPFLLRSSGPAAPARRLSREQTQAVYRRLASRVEGRLQLGQPVACGERDGVPVSALRMCSSSRHVVEAVRDGETGEARLLARADQALDLVAQVARSVAAGD